MTKETKNTVAAETIVENLKEFAETLHDESKEAMLYYLSAKNARVKEQILAAVSKVVEELGVIR